MITGDITQTDLGDRRKSGLAQALRLIGHLPGIAHMELTTADVVRHPLVRAIIKAYDEDDAAREAEQQARRAEQNKGLQDQSTGIESTTESREDEIHTEEPS